MGARRSTLASITPSTVSPKPNRVHRVYKSALSTFNPEIRAARGGPPDSVNVVAARSGRSPHGRLGWLWLRTTAARSARSPDVQEIRAAAGGGPFDSVNAVVARSGRSPLDRLGWLGRLRTIAARSARSPHGWLSRASSSRLELSLPPEWRILPWKLSRRYVQACAPFNIH